jgi:crotonobetainyl-CoA:carnitine CoA-transferase CaiB-like acyl-CoA transferase
MSQYENAIHFMGGLVLDYEVNKRVLGRKGNQCDYAAPHNAYRCLGEDRWCAIAVFTDEEWQSFCRVIGEPEWTRDPGFATLLGRKHHETELDRHIEEWTASRTAEEVMTLMQSAGVAAGVVENGEDLLDRDPQFKHRQTFVELEHPEGGKYRTQTGPHFKLSKVPFQLKRAPRLGEHNEYVLKGILGISGEEYDRLVKEGVID